MNKNYAKMKQTSYSIAKLKERFMQSNRDKSNNDIATLGEKNTFL